MDNSPGDAFGEIPPCKRGCGKGSVVLIPIKDTERTGFVYQCSVCTASTPVLALEEAHAAWTKDFSVAVDGSAA